MEISQLPEECIAHIISLTSPRDACKSCVVSPLFRSAADSDVVWEKFLPPDYKNFIFRSVAAETTPNSMANNKKALYFHLCQNPILIDDGNMSFAVDRESGKKCVMLGARGLSIIWGDTPQYWKWTSLPESRFSEVAKLKVVWWLDIKGKMDTNILSPKTSYAAYFVFKLAEDRYGFDRIPVEFHVEFEGRENGEWIWVFLDPSRNARPLPRDRGDGWKEIEMGELFNENGEDGPVLCSLKEVDGYNSKSGLIIEGIELRPKAGRQEILGQ